MNRYAVTIVVGVAILSLSPPPLSPIPVFLEPEPQAAASSDSDLECRTRVLHSMLGSYLTTRSGADKNLASRIVEVAEREAEKHGVDPLRILAFIIVESHLDPAAISSKGALGLMQILPSTGRYIAKLSGFQWAGSGDLRSVENNITYGTWYYDYLLHHYDGNELLAIAAYNWGPGRIDARLRRREELPRSYVNKVLLEEENLGRGIWRAHKTYFWQATVYCIANTYSAGG